jgi:hypothetical protein
MNKRQNTSILNYFSKKPRLEEESQNGCSSSDMICSESPKLPPTEETTRESPNIVETALVETAASSQQLQEVIPPYDIGKWIDVRFESLEKKLDAFKNIWTPAPDFVFPQKGKRNLRFQVKWLYRWKWLAYSPSQDGAYCKYCAFFTATGGGIGCQPLGKLCTVKFDTWKDAIDRFSAHDQCHYHERSIEAAVDALEVSTGKKTSIDMQLNEERKRQVQENRKCLVPIIETIFFCGRQNSALRGHRDCGRINVTEEPVENDGNFRLLRHDQLSVRLLQYS